MSRYTPTARLFKAIDLENAVVALGRQDEVVRTGAVGPMLRRDALARARIERASEDTWVLVAEFLTDRFGRRSA